jgi:hypothetical protein
MEGVWGRGELHEQKGKHESAMCPAVAYKPINKQQQKFNKHSIKRSIKLLNEEAKAHLGL